MRVLVDAMLIDRLVLSIKDMENPYSILCIFCNAMLRKKLIGGEVSDVGVDIPGGLVAK